MGWITDVQALLPGGGLLLLFAKALLILLLGALLADDVGLSAAAVRHRARFATLLCLALLPLLAWVAPRWQLPALHTGTAGAPGPLDKLLALLLLAYLAGVAWRGGQLLRDLLALLITTLRSAPAPLAWRRQFAALDPPARLRLRASAAIDSPLTWGYLKPVILVPLAARMSPREQRMALQHELGHVHRGDWLAHLLGRIVGVLYWPIPGLRHTLAQLALESEQACDNHVLAQDNNAPDHAPDYASLLLAQARGHRLRAAVPFSRQSQLAVRIRNICAAGHDHSVMNTGWPWLLPLCLLLTLPLAGLQLAPAPAEARERSPSRPLQPWSTATSDATAALTEYASPRPRPLPPPAVEPERPDALTARGSAPPPSPIGNNWRVTFQFPASDIATPDKPP
ncbi:M56 family metallopeptidase [Parahaliea mediterranea]|uniref:M56 family metallopeptidase n=1 Tax=Parahaliea mediterranea TaxID=651086 RepID=A0A939DH38_9GAMM|nr:M56 family metallopeptidase [Parahaliea mediterranea]MBN7798200.1 M56 family metallopeptidase [Parahaliea mediterranea]